MTLDATGVRSRRALLAGAVGGLAAFAAGAIGRAVPASAADPNDLVLGVYNDTLAGPTHLRNSGSNGSAFIGVATSTGDGVAGQAVSGSGINGVSHSGNGVRGEAIDGGATSIMGLKESPGIAVFGDVLSEDSGYAAVYGRHRGHGPAVYGENMLDGNGASGVAHGTGSGIYAQSDQGRGGLFVGKKAQIRLQPSTGASHPTSGAKGDLFVDKSGRLWFCKGATTWKQIA